MAWFFLGIAGLFEVVWAIGLKYSNGFSKVVPSVITIVAMLISFGFLAQALRTIPVGTGYAVWTGIGAVGTVLLGVILFAEPLTWLRIGCIILIISGIVGLKFAS